jgi:hypothetical protein
MRKPPPPHPRGTPRTPGSGRRRGTPNRKTVEMRALMTGLVHDVDYQCRLRQDFRRRRIHPTIEALVWAHTVGKPTERVQLSADVTMNQKLDQERELFSKLSVEQLEELAAESQGLVDRAMAMVRANGVKLDQATARRTPVEDSGTSDARGPKYLGTDVARSADRALPVGVSSSPAAAVDDAATGEAPEQPTEPR